MKQVEALPGFDALKQAMTMIQTLLQMMIIIVIPVLVMFSTYDPKTIVTISFALFALQFITFWWELSGWLDDRLITILYSSLAVSGLASEVPIADFLSSPRDGWIMNLVLGMMYVVFPWFWVGVHARLGGCQNRKNCGMVYQGGRGTIRHNKLAKIGSHGWGGRKSGVKRIL